MGKYLDTRELYKRQQELQEEIDTLNEERNDAEKAKKDAHSVWLEPSEEDEGDAKEAFDDAVEALDEAELALQAWIEENQEELDELNNLENEVGREWMHGETLIPEEDFVEYVQQLAEDIGATAGDDSSWLVIDWEATAENVRQDYSEAEYQGTTYLFRAS